ncbi:hypothetical protein JAAARDRAFT_35206 [Jaapia argillacea MUCL 33604]|uniref:Succinate dehydrogenase assembly factor 4, mitochondrial n=1 Tax=Jaapia argillacea MUCL 33604 TaxID=933084 RepID=A0A067PUG1_9AGAM|nr:hypothetical protein JAAARDRAFT_35206 [Jaapia argillacea MUCL 33604]
MRKVLSKSSSTARSSRFPSSPTIVLARHLSSPPLSRPSPPSLPAELQREFEELVRAAQAPLSRPSDRAESEAQLALHPDAPIPLKPEFEGNVNPKTGEVDGPKREPVKRYTEDEGDWSFKGRVSDF